MKVHDQFDLWNQKLQTVDTFHSLQHIFCRMVRSLNIANTSHF